MDTRWISFRTNLHSGNSFLYSLGCTDSGIFDKIISLKNEKCGYVKINNLIILFLGKKNLFYY